MIFKRRWFFWEFYKKYWIIELECYDPIYMNQCKVGDKIKLRWKLYKNEKDWKLYVILAPWIFTQQFLRNYLFF